MTLKNRVNTHFAELGVKKPRQADTATLAKISLNLLLWAGTWYRIVFSPFSAFACLLNMISRSVLIGQAHEAMHGNVLPQYPAIQRMFARFAIDGFLCTSLDDWWVEHVMFHHPHTKTEIDPDENIKQHIPVWRLTNATPWNPMHAYPLASHTAIGLLFPELRGLTGCIPRTLFSCFASIRSEGALALALLILLHWLPLFVQKDKKKGLLAVFLACMLTSLLALFSFHVNHVFAAADGMPQTNVDWGVRQMRTTSNFKMGYGSLLSGGLDLQIEHHLFPMLSYQLQQAVQPLIQETAKEFGILYQSYDSITMGYVGQLSYLVELGSKPEDECASISSENASMIAAVSCMPELGSKPEDKCARASSENASMVAAVALKPQDYDIGHRFSKRGHHLVVTCRGWGWCGWCCSSNSDLALLA
jgi:fatty acid desaturase